ncbi:hypothetical protein RJ640_028509 [Escallonia rubra]|uniref:Uncharacterized protein n=1 Tax=Escallonia rubra TaxID=112253 RepID=A0AA88UTB3_9ASTE|nr:hypothetical protein RJ640_028509 [Escallonia rubra]
MRDAKPLRSDNSPISKRKLPEENESQNRKKQRSTVTTPENKQLTSSVGHHGSEGSSKGEPSAPQTPALIRSLASPTIEFATDHHSQSAASPYLITDEYVNLARRLHMRALTKGPLLELKDKLEPGLLDRLEQLSNLGSTLEVGLEMADSVNLLKLFNFGDTKSELSLQKADAAAKRLHDGVALLKQEQDQLRAAVVDLLRSRLF